VSEDVAAMGVMAETLAIHSGGKETWKPSERVMVMLPENGRVRRRVSSPLLAGAAERAEVKASVTACGKESAYWEVLISAVKPVSLMRLMLRPPVDLERGLGGRGHGGCEGVVVDGVDEAARVIATVGDGAVNDTAGTVVAGAEIEAEALGGDDVVGGELGQVGAQLAQTQNAGGAEEGRVWRGGVGEDHVRESVADGRGGGIGLEVMGVEVQGVLAILDRDVGGVAGVGSLILWNRSPAVGWC
jgi:hypothetical protein